MNLHEQIFEATPDAMLVVSSEGRVLQANGQVKALFGYTREELIGEPIERLVPARYENAHVALRAAYAAHPRPRPMGAGKDLFALHKSGREVPVDILLSPIDDGDGARILCVVRDITDRLRLQENLRGLIESAPDAMVIAREDGRIVRINAQTERMFGYARAELLGRPVEVLIPERFRRHHPEHRARYFAAPQFRPMGMGLELQGLRKDGSEFPVEISLSLLETEEGRLVSGAIRDTTERLRAERLLGSLQEKEALLKEIHHRVKNNLAVVSSLLYLQSTHTADPGTASFLRESQERVRSMALVHELLYLSENYSAIDFGEYASRLCDQILRTYTHPAGPVRLEKRLASVPMSLEIAVPCGLILNELVANAMRHAFPTGSGGQLRITVESTEQDTCTLRVADSGVGLPEGLDPDGGSTLGLRLIRTLTRQVDGQFELTSTSPGTEARLRVRCSR